MTSPESASKNISCSYALDFVAIGANRQANCASWGRNGLVAYSAGKLVGIYDPIEQQLLGTLPGHKDRVTSAQWVPVIEGEGEEENVEVELVSASMDKTLRLWKANKADLGRRPLRFVPSAPLKGHEAGISGIAVHLHRPTGSLLIASTAIDGTVVVWKRSGADFSVLQVFKFGSKLVESLAFAQVPGSTACLLACGAVDNLVHVFACDDSVSKFSKLTSLSGHESWVRSLAFAEFVNASSGTPYLLLASAAQDRRVRLWRFEATTAKTDAPRRRLNPAELLAQLEANEEGQLEIEQHAIITTLPNGARWNIQLESVILGHDDWVLSANWMPRVRSEDGKLVQMPRLLTASMDKTMVVWTPDVDTGLWVEATRVGEVGGNQLGFFGSLYGAYPSEAILALGYNGAFHLWRKVSGNESSSAPSSLDSFVEHWEPQVAISGHFGEVKDVAWDPSGKYLVSVAKDQTARIWAHWTRKEEYTKRMLGDKKWTQKNDVGRYNWHELARPVVHGHDLSGVVFQSGIGHRFVLCAEEKVLRVFDAPTAFLRSMVNLSQGISLEPSDAKRAASANVPALGLSNKPVYERVDTSTASSGQKNDAEKLYETIHPNGGYGDFDINSDQEGHTPLVLTNVPPFEEQLLQRSLWPEVAKLYGHGNELVTVTSSRNGDIIASACSCKVQTQEQAGLRIWDTSIWKETCEVPGPTLTVTQMQFSHCDQYLVAVSRDRGAYLMRRTGKDPKKMELVASVPKAHLRVVWSCSWSHDDKFIATGSRDKMAKFWRIKKEGEEISLVEALSVKFKSGVTAVAFAPYDLEKHCGRAKGEYVVAVAMEDGGIQLLLVTLSDALDVASKHEVLCAFDEQDVHVDSVKKMTWQSEAEGLFHLATGSNDQSVRIFTVRLSASS